MKKLSKMLICALLVVCFITSLCTPALAASFSDVAETHWAYGSIDKISEKGYMIGRGTPGGTRFDPEGQIMGVEVYETLYRIADKKLSEKYYEGELSTNPYIFDEELNDWVRQDDQWFTDSTKWAIRCGLAYAEWTESAGDGIPGDFVVFGRFGSEFDPIEYHLKPGTVPSDVSSSTHHESSIATRSDVVLMLYYYVSTYMGHEITDKADLSVFTDWNIDENDTYTYNYASCLYMAHATELIAAWEWAVGSGIIKGCGDGTLQLGEYNKETKTRRYITRAEYATILDRFTAYLETVK